MHSRLRRGPLGILLISLDEFRYRDLFRVDWCGIVADFLVLIFGGFN